MGRDYLSDSKQGWSTHNQLNPYSSFTCEISLIRVLDRKEEYMILEQSALGPVEEKKGIKSSLAPFFISVSYTHLTLPTTPYV